MKFSGKKLFYLICLILLIILISIVGWFLAQPNEGKIVESDGTRTLGSGTIRNEGFTDDSQFRDQVTTSCFTYQLPKQYSPKIEETEEKCVARSGIFDPKGALTVSWEKMRSDQRFDENTGIQLRIKNPDQYFPVNLDDSRFVQILSFESEGETTMFADTEGGILVVSLHDFVGTGDQRLAIARQVLQSVQLKR